MFFYDAPEIWLSRICKPKSHPLGSSKPSCTVCAAIQAVLSGLPEEMDRHGHCEPNENQPEGNLSVMLFHQAWLNLVNLGNYWTQSDIPLDLDNVGFVDVLLHSHTVYYPHKMASTVNRGTF